MTSDIGCACFVARVWTVKVSDVLGLQNEDNDPVYASNDRVQSERGIMMVVLTPNCMTVVMSLAVCGGIECIVCSWDDYQEPWDDGQDLVGNEVASTELFAFGKRIV